VREEASPWKEGEGSEAYRKRAISYVLNGNRY
jgi:hypothetical protein